MTPEQREAACEERERKLAALTALEQNPVWQGFYKKLCEKRDAAAAEHENEKLTAEKRAEYLHAMKMLRDLAEDLNWMRKAWTEFIADTRKGA